VAFKLEMIQPHLAERKVWPEFRSKCPVASAVDIIGDKWTLVVLRTIFAGPHRYHELSEIPEKIATNILADRLDRLELYGLITKSPYQENPTRYDYRLTRRGADLLPVLQGLAAWAGQHIPGRWESPPWFSKGKPEDFYQTKNL
jgi:DNA-binding HxlR family transcriptional regulator